MTQRLRICLARMIPARSTVGLRLTVVALACALLACASPSRVSAQTATGDDRSARGDASAPGEAQRGEGEARPGEGVFQRGKAAWYGDRYHGRKTASGERFDMNDLTAAHRTLPFGTVVQVKNLANDRAVNVRINDRGPFGRKERIIDVSKAAARELGMLGSGVVPVELRVVRRPGQGDRSAEP